MQIKNFFLSDLSKALRNGFHVISGFGGIRTHDILTQKTPADWLRARRSTWLSYEPTKNLQTKVLFKLN